MKHCYIGAGFGVDSGACSSVFSVNSGVGTVVRSGAGSGVGSLTFSGACPCLVLFIGNILLLKLFRIFSLALRKNPMLFKKYVLSNGFIRLYKPVKLTHLTLNQYPIISNFHLKNRIGNKYLLKIKIFSVFDL